jgi:hypothetical protein
VCEGSLGFRIRQHMHGGVCCRRLVLAMSVQLCRAWLRCHFSATEQDIRCHSADKAVQCNHAFGWMLDVVAQGRLMMCRRLKHSAFPPQQIAFVMVGVW